MSELYPNIELKNITTQTVNNSAIQGLNLSLMPGEVHAILSTQSFALEMLLQLFKNKFTIVEGQVFYLNQPTNIRRLQKQCAALSIISEQDNLYPSFTALDNIYFFHSKYVHGHRSKLVQRCRSFLNRYHIPLDLNKKVFELSSEERKMVEIMRACMMGSKVIVMHETLSRVMDTFVAQFSSLLDDMRKQGISILYLTTQASDALAIADRISIFSDGTMKGTMLNAEAKTNPQKLFSMLAGGNLFEDSGHDSQEQELLSVITAARDIMSTNKELRGTLNFLADNLKRIKRAADCMIYVINERDNLVISSDASDQAPAKLMPEALRDVMNLFVDSKCVFTREDPVFQKLFFQTGGIRQVYCYSVFVRYDITALIQLSFCEEDAMNDQDTPLITTFCREVRIAIETSLILEHSSLLQESHHRIKNNLQSIIGLIYMQKYRLLEQEDFSKEMMNETLLAIINRIKSIASIHDILSKDRFGWNNVDLEWLTRRILQFYEKSDIQITLDMDEIRIPYNKATSFALLMNELISNCTKHAFVGMESGKKIRITCKIQNQTMLLQVSDNGVGIGEKFQPDKQNSIGMSVISSVAQELNAQLSYNQDDGTTVSMVIPTEVIYRI